MRILHLITRMILGGAQENTLLTCEDLLPGFALPLRKVFKEAPEA